MLSLATANWCFATYLERFKWQCWLTKQINWKSFVNFNQDGGGDVTYNPRTQGTKKPLLSSQLSRFRKCNLLCRHLQYVVIITFYKSQTAIIDIFPLLFEKGGALGRAEANSERIRKHSERLSGTRAKLSEKGKFCLCYCTEPVYFKLFSLVVQIILIKRNGSKR